MSSDDATNILGGELLTALTQDEIGDLLNALWEVLSSEQLEAAITMLPLETQETFWQVTEKLFSDEPLPDIEILLSQSKLAETWSSLWQEWFDVVDLAAQAEGRYIVQEVRWEAPYFDDYAFAEDLDAVAEKMRLHLSSVFQLSLSNKNSFVSALTQATSEIVNAIPDWMELVDGINLGEQATYCLLEWEWLCTQQQQDAFAFAQHIREIEIELSPMKLSDDAMGDFLWALPETDQLAILEGLKSSQNSPLWKTVLTKTYSPWREYLNDKARESLD